MIVCALRSNKGLCMEIVFADGVSITKKEL